MEEKLLYSKMNYPKFIWVCEFSTFFTYTREKKVIGEIVLDATASRACLKNKKCTKNMFTPHFL